MKKLAISFAPSLSAMMTTCAALGSKKLRSPDEESPRGVFEHLKS